MLLSICILGFASHLAVAAPAHPEWWSEAAAQAAVAPAVEVSPRDVAIDGRIDEWREGPALPLGLTHQTGFDRDWRGRSDLSAMVWFAASDAGLYVVAEVTDDKPIPAVGTDRLRGDQVRVYLAESHEATGVEARPFALVPPLTGGEVTRPAAVLDGDRGDPVPGAAIAWEVIDTGYRVEARLPWPAIPGLPEQRDERLGLFLEVLDWDDTSTQRAALSWPAEIRPPAPEPAAKTTGYQPPRLAEPWRPKRLGELRRIDAFELDDAGEFLPALLPLGAERSYYTGGETVRVIALTGVGVPTASLLDVYAVDADGEIVLLTRGDAWSEGAVSGVVWSWRTPYEFPASRLVAARLDRPGLEEARVYGRIESVGEGYTAHLDRLEALREKMMAAATAPGADEKRRRYVGAVLIQLEDKELGTSGWSQYLARDDLDELAKDLETLEQQFEVALSGKDPYAGKKGTYLRGYVSDIDDTLQFYSVSIPEAWTPTKPMPLVISLHGYGFGRFHGHPAPSYTDRVSVACYGRGNGDYKLWCERDIVYVLDAMIEDYNLDENRVYSTGGSMGGTGSWHIATMYPDRFAAIGPTASNTNHHVWEEVWGWGQREPTFMTPFRDWLESTTSAFQYAENLRTVGAYALHGAQDNICPVGHDRTMTARLRNLGYDVVYEEFPTVGHGGFPGAAGTRQKNFMFARARDPYPRHVTFKSSWHRYAGSYWLRLERFLRQAKDGELDARIDGQTITVQTVNVRRLGLALNEHLVDVEQPVTVRVDGLPAYEGELPSDGYLRLGYDGVGWRAVEPPAGLEKNPRVGGPVEHAFMQRFLLVCGTSGDRRENEVNRRMTEQLAEKWRRWGRDQPARVKMDYEVNEQDIADSNLICFGGPRSNRFTAQVNDRLPVRYVDGGIRFGDETFSGRDVGAKLCYPNPLNPERYLCIFAGVTWEGTYDINGRFGNWFDWGIFDDRNWFDVAVFDAHTQSPETFLAVGYFDQDWGLGEEAVIFRGDPEMRAATQPRRPPDPLAPLPEGEVVYLSELTPTQVNMEKGVLGYDQSFGGRPITLGEMQFERGLGVHPQAEVIYDIDGAFQTFEAWVGVDLEGAQTVSKAREEAERVAFQVYGDGRLLADTGEMRWNTPPKHLLVKVDGVEQLTLMARALDGRKWLFGDSSWGLARLSRSGEAFVASQPRIGAADRLGLDGQWRLEDFSVGEGISQGAERSMGEVPTERRLQLPGTVPAALLAAGEIEDPYLNDGIRQLDALAKREWWLYRQVDVPAAWDGRRVELDLSGVVQHADVWVNGTWIGEVDGPFVERRLDATKPLKFGAPNLLAIRLLAGPAGWTNVRNFAVPARDQVIGYGVAYGADGGGQAIPLGITGDLALVASGPIRLSAARVTARPTSAGAAGEGARVPVEITIDTTLRNTDSAAHEVTLRGRIVPPDESDAPVSFERRLRVEPGDAAPLRVKVDAPGLKLWWPRGVGNQTVYRLELEVRDEQGASDRRDEVFGVREVSLDTSGEPLLLINGTPLAPRIAEWQTPDRLLQASPRAVRGLLEEAAASGINTLRVTAGAGLETPEFYRLCDELGLLVIQDLPLTGDLGRAPASDLAGAVEQTLLRCRNHPSVIAFGQGSDLPDTPATSQRLGEVDDRLRRLAPEHWVIEPTTARAGETIWRWRRAEGSGYQQRLELMPVWQLRLPAAPPAELTFLTRDELPVNERLTPWPLTDWWRLHGGSDADLRRAQEWLGGVRDAERMEDLLRWWQAEVARRQLAEAVTSPAAVMVGPLNESWPRIGPALIDHGGQARPARDMVARFLTGPVVFSQPSTTALARDEILTVDIHAGTGGDRGWWSARPASWETVVCRIQDLAGRTWAEREIPLSDEPFGKEPVGTLTWEVDETVPAGAYLLVTTAPGSTAAPDIVPLAVHEQPRPAPVKVAWLAADALELPGIAPVRTAAEGDVIYLGPGYPQALEEEQWAALERQIRDGAGLLIDGPPEWLVDTPAEAWLAAVPAGSPPEFAPEPVTPEAVMADHPALAGLAGRLPQGLPGDYQTLRDGAEVLVRYGPDRPLLLETRLGRGRILLFRADRDYRRRLELWDGRDRFYTGLFAYLAKLPFTEAKKLLTRPDDEPLEALLELPPAPVKLTLTTSPLTPRPQRPEVREIRVRNDGATPIPLLRLRLEGLPAGMTARFSETSFPLLPGDEQKVLLTVDEQRRGGRTGKVTLRADGWGAAPVAVELGYDTGG